MVPSLFILIDRWSGNENGKLDKTALPPPDFSLLLLSFDSTSIDDEDLRAEMERRVASIWCHRLLIRLNHSYQREFPQSMNITDLFHSTSIVGNVCFL